MMKAVCIFGVVFGILAALIFGLDLAIELPFGCPSPTLDIGFIVSGLILAYLSWSAKGELG
jgi:hypothetical protein